MNYHSRGSAALRVLLALLVILLQHVVPASSAGTTHSLKKSPNQGFNRKAQAEEVVASEPSVFNVPTISLPPSPAAPSGVVAIIALLSFNFPDKNFWDGSRLPALQTAVEEYLEDETSMLKVPFEIELLAGDRFLQSSDDQGGDVDITLIVTTTEEDLGSRYVSEDYYRDTVVSALRRGEREILRSASAGWQYAYAANGASAENGAALHISLPSEGSSPSPADSLSMAPTDDFWVSTVEIPILFSFIFPNETFWKDEYMYGVKDAIDVFFGENELTQSLDINLSVEKGNPYAVESGLDFMLDGLAGNNNATNNETETIGENVQVTIVLSFPSNNLLDSFITEDLFKELIQEQLNVAQRMVKLYISQSLSYDLETNGVHFSIDFLILAPTVSPTYAPTTIAHGDSVKRRQKIRSWTFMTIFWLIVITCFALENGLCACSCFGRKKDDILD